VPHTLPILQVRNTNHEAPDDAAFRSPLTVPASYAKMYFSSHCSRTPPACVLAVLRDQVLHPNTTRGIFTIPLNPFVFR
jgi:hypothetical protein